MLRRLREFDPERAAKLPAGDKRRIVRAIEIYKLTGMTITKHDARTRVMPPRYDAAQIILGYADRAALYARIDRRVDEMVAEGLFEEVQGLLDSGLSEQCTAMQAIGYKEPAMALRGEITVDLTVSGGPAHENQPPLCQAPDDMVPQNEERAADRLG